MMDYHYWVVRITILTTLFLVQQSNAQINVSVTFDPPSPVPKGNTTFRCEFALATGQSLSEQYWATIGTEGVRFFIYRPGNELIIDPEFKEKIHYHDTDNTTYLEIIYEVTACDTQTFQCHVYDLNADEGQDQQSLAVENLKKPTLKYGGDVVVEGEDPRVHSTPQTVSCELNDAGPPQPDILELEVLEGDDVNATSSEDPIRESDTCSWSYNPPLTVTVNNVTGKLRLRCRAYYRDTGPQYSPELTLVAHPCDPSPCLNNGNCSIADDLTYVCTCTETFTGTNCETDLCDECQNNSTCGLDANGEIVCECPEDVHGEFCGDISCLGNECNADTTCMPEDFGGFNYTCNCTGLNLYGPLCNTTGCMVGDPVNCTCENGGTCRDTLEECRCDCPTGCTGARCDNYEEDLCSQCVNSIDCDRTSCSDFTCTCDFNFNGTLCDQACEMETDNNAGFYTVFPESNVTLFCDSDDAIFVSWIRDDVNIANGTNLTIVGVVEGEIYSCRVWGPDCNIQLSSNVTVERFEILDNGTTSSGTKTISSDGSIDLIASIVPSNPMPMLHWLKENNTIVTTDSPSGFQSTILDTGKYIVLNSSDDGSVRYYKPEVNSSDSGTYVAMAMYGDYYQIISTVELTIDCFLGLNTSEEGNYNVTLGGELILFCETEENSTVWWEKNGTTVWDGSLLVLDPAHLANSSLYSCVVNTSECSRQLDFNVVVLEPIWEINLEANETENMKENLTESQNYTLQCSIDITNPLPSLSWIYMNISDTICTVDDATMGEFKKLNTSYSGSVSYTVSVVTDDEGCYLCVANSLDSNENLRAVFLSVLMTSSDGDYKPPPNGLPWWAILLIVYAVVVVVLVIAIVVLLILELMEIIVILLIVLGVLIPVLGIIILLDRFEIIHVPRFWEKKQKHHGSSDERDIKEKKPLEEGDDGLNNPNHASQEEVKYAKPIKKMSRGKVEQAPRTKWEPEDEPTRIPITQRLPPIGKSEPDHNGVPPPAENSPKRKKKSRRRRKAPDGQLDDSFEPEYQPRPLPQPSALKKLPPIEHIDTDFGHNNKAFHSTEL